MSPLEYNPIPIEREGSALEQLGRFSIYEPNYAILPYLRELLNRGDAAIREFVLDTALRFVRRYNLSLPAPRHDFMDHNLPFAIPLNTSQIHETFADLVKRAILNLVRGVDEKFPYEFLDITLLARLEFDKYDFYEDIEYLYDFGPQIWQATTDFYREAGQENTQRIWTIACKLHFEMRGVPYHDEYFGLNPTPAGGKLRCG